MALTTLEMKLASFFNNQRLSFSQLFLFTLFQTSFNTEYENQKIDQGNQTCSQRCEAAPDSAQPSTSSRTRAFFLASCIQITQTSCSEYNSELMANPTSAWL